MKIKITDFTLTPGPRFKTQGPSSAEEFYDDILQPNLQLAISNNTKLYLDFNGVFGYYDSFFDEIFKRLKNDFKRKELYHHLIISYTDDPDQMRYIRSIYGGPYAN